jgi:hypothetical protein
VGDVGDVGDNDVYTGGDSDVDVTADIDMLDSLNDNISSDDYPGDANDADPLHTLVGDHAGDHAGDSDDDHVLPPSPPLSPPASPSRTSSNHGSNHGSSTSATSAIHNLNKLLGLHGFSSVSSMEDVVSVLGTVLQSHSNRGVMLEKAAASSSSNALNSSIASAASNASNDETAQQRKLTLLKNENALLKEEMDALKRKCATSIRTLKTTISSLNTKLQTTVSQCEVKIRTKDTLLDKLQSKLVGYDKKKTVDDVTVSNIFKSVNGRSYRKNSTSDQAAYKIIGMYEEHKERIEDEVEQLRNEVKSLNGMLKEKENRVIRDTTQNISDRASQEAESRYAKEQEQHREIEKFKLQQESFAKKFAKLESKLSDVRDQLKLAQDENTNLLLEVNSRPTVKQQRASERRIDDLERKLYAAVEAATTAGDVRELRKHAGTKSLIDTDKINHRLRLERLDSIPREISKEILKECCRELSVSDVTLIAPSIKKMSKAMLLLPRLEAFINEVCSFVFKGGSNNKGGGKRSMEEVMPVLRQWDASRNQAGKSMEFRAIVVGELCRRSVVKSDNNVGGKGGGGKSDSNYPGMTSEISDEQALRAIRDLVELEKLMLNREDLYQNAESVVQANPDLFVNRVVLHFRYLFGVKQMEGVFPKMNEVYLFVNEMNAFIRELRGMFGMSKSNTATVVKAMLEVASELHKSNQLQHYSKGRIGKGAREGGDGDEGDEDGEEQLENYVVM